MIVVRKFSKSELAYYHRVPVLAAVNILELVCSKMTTWPTPSLLSRCSECCRCCGFIVGTWTKKLQKSESCGNSSSSSFRFLWFGFWGSASDEHNACNILIWTDLWYTVTSKALLSSCRILSFLTSSLLKGRSTFGIWRLAKHLSVNVPTVHSPCSSGPPERHLFFRNPKWPSPLWLRASSSQNVLGHGGL